MNVQVEFILQFEVLNNFLSIYILKNILSKCERYSSCSEANKPYIFATQCRRPFIFQTMNSVRSKSLSLEYQRFTPAGCKDMGIISLW